MAKSKRPLTVREHQKKREKESSRDRETILIMNTSDQMVTIHVKPPANVDFYIGAQDVYLRPGISFTFPKHRLWDTQISRLQKRRFITIISDSKKQKELKEKKLVDAENDLLDNDEVMIIESQEQEYIDGEFEDNSPFVDASE